ncbi:MAG: HAD family hydrolase [Saccharofermentanales bacterium]|jgi:phosphoglycolate phosphatase
MRRQPHIAALFDLDGTLLYTLPSIVASCNAMLERLRLAPLSMDQVREFVGSGSRVLVERAMRAHGITEGERIEHAYRTYTDLFKEGSRHHVAPYPGIIEMLDDLHNAGIKLGVITNKDHDLTPGVLATSFDLSRFDVILGTRPNVPLKPDPASTLEALDQMGCDAKASFFIGDSVIDVDTGRNAGMQTVSATWGYRSSRVLAAAHPDFFADAPEDVTAIVLRTSR